MSLSIDAAAVLRAFADHSGAFPAIQADIGDFARKALIKQIKHKTFSLPVAAKARECLGDRTLRTAVDSLSPSEALALLKKLDPNNPLVKEGDQPIIRSTIDGLIAGRTEPVAKAVKTLKAPTRKAPAGSKPQIGIILGSKVHAGDAQSRPSKVKKAAGR